MNGNPNEKENRLFAYIDETGTNELDSTKTGVSHLFICVAVIVDLNSRSLVESGVVSLGNDFCGGAEVASKRIGGDHEKRLRYLNRIKDLPFGYYALIINKDRIPKDSGLQYKKSFYKYINRMLYERLRKSGQNMSITADQIGGKDFMDSFESYLKQRGMPDLFQDYAPIFADSKVTPLIQLADLVAGTISYCVDPAKRNEYSSDFRSILRNKEIGVHCWPVSFFSRDATISCDGSVEDELESAMTKRVDVFIDTHENSPVLDRQMQAAVLSHLLAARSFEERENQAVVSTVLMENLRRSGFEEMSKQGFQSRVIGKIRDEGIALAGAQDGYRLALSIGDMNDYLHHDRTVMEPMIARMSKARESVLIDTSRRYDILDGQEHQLLRAVAIAFQDAAITAGVRPVTEFEQ